MRHARSLDSAYFQSLYAQDPDPWRLATRAYEAAKYDATIAALGEARARSALELGCSVGVLTRRLAGCCDRLLATDLAPVALDQARRRCADQPHVRFRLARGPTDGLEAPLDLIVLSEVVYYWDDEDIAAVGRRIRRVLEPGGRILLVHWLGETDYPKSADEAVEALAAAVPPMTVERQSRTALYRLDLWRRPADRSDIGDGEAYPADDVP
jgi:SAM-dependent methyltransferase